MSECLQSKPLIFLIDNDPVVYESLLSTPHLNDYQLLFYLTMAELMSALKHALPICLIIEANLKPISGIQIYRTLLAGKLAPPTVFITTTGEIAEAVEVMRLGAIDYIEKPFISGKLLSAIKIAHGTGSLE